MCQKKKTSENLSSGEIGRIAILAFAEDRKCNDIRAIRVLELTEQEQSEMKYHRTSCYRSFQRDMTSSNTYSRNETLEESSPFLQVTHSDIFDRCSKRLKCGVIRNVCIFCGSNCKTIRQKKIHKLFRICEKSMAQKLLNAAMLFKDHVYTETAAMHEVNDVFAADILYHDHCCKSYFYKYNAKIDEILKNLKLEDSVTIGDDSLKARFLALGLDFRSSAYSLTSIRDMLNEGSPETVSNRAVKQLIIKLYGDTVCFTYPCNHVDS